MVLCRLPDYQTSFESTGLSVREKKLNADFQDGDHLGITFRTILSIFDLHITSIFQMKFRVNWPFG